MAFILDFFGCNAITSDARLKVSPDSRTESKITTVTNQEAALNQALIAISKPNPSIDEIANFQTALDNYFASQQDPGTTPLDKLTHRHSFLLGLGQAVEGKKANHPNIPEIFNLLTFAVTVAEVQLRHAAVLAGKDLRDTNASLGNQFVTGWGNARDNKVHHLHPNLLADARSACEYLPLDRTTIVSLQQAIDAKRSPSPHPAPKPATASSSTSATSASQLFTPSTAAATASASSSSTKPAFDPSNPDIRGVSTKQTQSATNAPRLFTPSATAATATIAAPPARSAPLPPAAAVIIRGLQKQPRAEQETIDLYTQLNSLTTHQMFDLHTQNPTHQAALTELYNGMMRFFGSAINNRKELNLPLLLPFLRREINHPNYPFNFTDINIDPDNLLRNLILGVMARSTEEQRALMNTPDFVYLYEQALPLFLEGLNNCLNDRDTGLNVLIGYARGRLGSGATPADIHKLLLREDANLGPDRNLNITHCIILPELCGIIGMIGLCRIKDQKLSTNTYIQAHTLAKRLQPILAVYAAGVAEIAEIPKQLTAAIVSLEQVLGLRDAGGRPIQQPLIDDKWLAEFNKDKYTCIHNEIMALDAQIKNGKTPDGFELRKRILYHMIHLSSDLPKIRELELKFFTLILNFENQNRIYILQKTCVEQLKKTKTRKDVEAVHNASKRAYIEAFGNTILGVSQATQNACFSAYGAVVNAESRIEPETFATAVGKASHRKEVTHNQYELPGLNAYTKVLEERGTSKNACGCNAAYALYYEMWKNHYAGEAGGDWWVTAAQNLEKIMFQGTSRYQDVLSEIAKRQVDSLVEWMQAERGDVAARTTVPEKKRAALLAFCDAGYSPKYPNSTAESAFSRAKAAFSTNFTVPKQNELQREFKHTLAQNRPDLAAADRETLATKQVDSLIRLIQAEKTTPPVAATVAAAKTAALNAFREGDTTLSPAEIALYQAKNTLQSSRTPEATMNKLYTDYLLAIQHSRPLLSYASVMGDSGFKGILIPVQPEEVAAGRWSGTLRQNEEATQYAEYLNTLATTMGQEKQIGAFFQKGGKFMAVILKKTAENAYSITIVDTHGSDKESHAIHHKKAFSITFNSVQDAAHFMALHFPHGDTSDDPGARNQFEFYPLKLGAAPVANSSESRRINADLQYATDCEMAMQRRVLQQNSVSTFASVSASAFAAAPRAPEPKRTTPSAAASGPPAPPPPPSAPVIAHTPQKLVNGDLLKSVPNGQAWVYALSDLYDKLGGQAAGVRMEVYQQLPTAVSVYIMKKDRDADQLYNELKKFLSPDWNQRIALGTAQYNKHIVFITITPDVRTIDPGKEKAPPSVVVENRRVLDNSDSKR